MPGSQFIYLLSVVNFNLVLDCNHESVSFSVLSQYYYDFVLYIVLIYLYTSVMFSCLFWVICLQKKLNMLRQSYFFHSFAQVL